MPWAKFDDKAIRSRKVRRVARKSPQAALLWMFAIIYCCEQQTDGEIEGDELRELLPHHHEDFIKTLLAERMLHDRPGCDSDSCLASDGLPVADTDMYVIHDFAATQLLRADWERLAEEKAKKGRYGMHKRWHERRNIVDPECEFCADTG